ncbi:MAG: sugar phosphate isomerase/epimerase [Chloroflexi bacterium]|nr:sugar phosphate isomerase/epimerase [Chloroflexota bacterium]
MKLCYALRRGVFYPNARDAFGEMPPREHRPKYLALVRSFGFEGVEIPVVSGEAAADAAAEDLGAVLRDAGVPAVCVRGGGAIAHPTAGLAARDRLEAAIRLAARIGAGVVNATCVTPSTHPGGPGHDRRGEPVSQGGSRTASVGDFERTAEQFRRFGALAGDLGVEISIEVHQGSIADNSAAALALIDLIGLDNVGVNPDLGNIYWHYEHPEETAEAAIVALAPRANYWHCKNLRRIHIPELERALYQRVPLPDGDIDYRFAIAAMVDAGYEGFLAVEGAREGDQLTADARAAAYVRELLADLDR